MSFKSAIVNQSIHNTQIADKASAKSRVQAAYIKVGGQRVDLAQFEVVATALRQQGYSLGALLDERA